MLIFPEAKLTYRWTVLGRECVNTRPTSAGPARVAVHSRRHYLRPSNSMERINSRERIMYHFAAALFGGIIATGLISGTAFVPTPAEAAKMSKADTVALKEATAACKAEAKDKKIRWPASRKFVNNCVMNALKDRPNTVAQVALKEATIACKAEARGKKVKWLARRKYVYQCVAEALKGRPSMDIWELRRGVNMKGLQGQRPGEWGCDPMC